MTDIEIIKAAQSRARVFVNSDSQPDTDQAAIDGYEEDSLRNRRDLWDTQQELIYRYAYALQLLALGL